RRVVGQLDGERSLRRHREPRVDAVGSHEVKLRVLGNAREGKAAVGAEERRHAGPNHTDPNSFRRCRRPGRHHDLTRYHTRAVRPRHRFVVPTPCESDYDHHHHSPTSHSHLKSPPKNKTGGVPVRPPLKKLLFVLSAECSTSYSEGCEPDHMPATARSPWNH